MRRLGLRARRGLGQHFLADSQVLGHILAAAGVSPQDTVIEVGPGLGWLTRELVARAGRVVAVEMDPPLARALPEILGFPSNLTVLQADIRSLDPAKLCEGAPYKVVANLPYYIAAPTIRLFLEAEAKPQRMVVMVQKEVARNMAAGPGRMGLLSVAVQLYARPRLVVSVPARSFYPVPKVESAVVCLDVYPRPALDIPDMEEFFHLVRAGFSAPRKQLRNSLAQGLGRPAEWARELLEKAGISHQRRPQSLSLEEWGQALRAYQSMGDASC